MADWRELSDDEISKIIWNEDGEVIDPNLSHIGRNIAQAQVQAIKEKVTMKDWNPIEAMGIGERPKLIYDEMLKIWAQIEALDELKAKLALFGLTMKELGRSKEPNFYLIALKKENRKLFWRWTRGTEDEWKEITDIHSFLTTYYPPGWHSYILETMGIKE